jgi:hypothetical protein
LQHAQKGEPRHRTASGVARNLLPTLGTQCNHQRDQQGVEVRKFSRKTIIIASSMALVIATSVVAYAFWTNNGAGSGSASTGTNTVTVHQLSTPSGLVPNGPAAPLFGDFTNPNSSAVTVNTVGATISSVVGGPENPTVPCTATDFVLYNNPTGVYASVPPGSHVGAWTGMSIQLVDTGLNQDNCKGATVQISYSTT